jgi:glycosyltransferase involved in cell wall biosynthesis
MRRFATLGGRVSRRVLVVIPTYNESASILPLASSILARDPELEVLVVDDASPDGTGDRVAREAEREPRLHLVRRSGKLGLGSAYLAGFHCGLDRGCDQIVPMDGDGSHDPTHLDEMRNALVDHHMVIGSRYVPGGGIANWKLHRRALSRFANWYTRVLLGLSQHDCTSGYRGYRREVLERVDPFSVKSSGYSFLEEMVWRVHRAGFQIAEVPIVFTDRHLGISKIDRYEILMAAWHVLVTALNRLFGRAPAASRAPGSSGRSSPTQ